MRNNDLEKAITFLKSYKWSSFSDYAGVKQFSGYHKQGFFFELYETNESDYLKHFNEWLIDNSQRGTLTVDF